ncbi:MAG: ferredoxin [Deltaproteobacteria bacterium]|nr:ferredoxin [Deltaproteobacteria bacterium]
MKVTIDEDACIGCEACSDELPEVFEMVDDKAKVKDPNAAPVDKIKEVAEACPTEAITVEE